MVCLSPLQSTLICLGLLELFQITIEWFGKLEPLSGTGLGRDRKSQRAILLRAPPCGANKLLLIYIVALGWLELRFGLLTLCFKLMFT